MICAPVLGEVRFGLERLPARSRRRKLLERELRIVREAVRWADWTEPAALEFGRLKAVLERRGQRIDDMDVAIAAIASHLEAAVATCNVRHFERIDDLVVHERSTIE